MKSKKLRTFILNEKEMVFNVRLFQELFNKNAKNNNIGIGVYEEEMSNILFVDKSAIHNWRMNINGPGSIEIIQKIAKFWNINYEVLLVEVNDMRVEASNNTKRLSESEKVALKKVYHSFLNYMIAFKNTDGFLFNVDGSEYDIKNAYLMYENLKYALQLEYVDLKRTMYDELEEFFEGEFTVTLGHGYIPGEDSLEQLEAEALEKYEELMNKFKEIVDAYLVD